MRILHRGPEHCFLYHLICSLYLVNISMHMTSVHSGIQWNISLKPLDIPPPPSSYPLPVHRANLGSQRQNENFKVPLSNPRIFFLLKKSTSFPDFISEKVISIDKILAFLQAFEHVISMLTTAQSGIWVELLVTSFREPSWNTQETFDWA